MEFGHGAVLQIRQHPLATTRTTPRLLLCGNQFPPFEEKVRRFGVCERCAGVFQSTRTVCSQTRAGPEKFRRRSQPLRSMGLTASVTSPTFLTAAIVPSASPFVASGRREKSNCIMGASDSKDKKSVILPCHDSLYSSLFIRLCLTCPPSEGTSP